MFLNLILLTSSMFINSCSNLPTDLQSKKDACTDKYKELANREENANSSSDYKQLINDYTSLKNEIISYTAECNRRGISKENDEVISKINGKISQYQSLVHEENSSSSYSSSNEQPSNEASNSKSQNIYAGSKCKNCGIGYYDSEGICTMCDGASPSRVEESYSKQYKSCEGCNGTGRRGDEICPMCYGKGKYMPY